MSKELEQYIAVDDGEASEPVSRDEYEGTMIGTSLADLIDDLQSRKEEAEAKPVAEDEAAAEGDGDAGSPSLEDSQFVIVGELDLGDADLEPATPAPAGGEPQESGDFEIVTTEAAVPDPAEVAVEAPKADSSDGGQPSAREAPAQEAPDTTGAAAPQGEEPREAEAKADRRKADRRKGDRRKGDRRAESSATAQAEKASVPKAEGPQPTPAAAAETGAGADSDESVDLSGYTRELEDILRRAIEEERQRANARIMREVGRAMDAARQAVKKKTAKIEARLKAEYAEKEATLKRDSDQLLNLANKVAQQKADIQRARKQLEQNLKAAGQLHTQVNEICSALGERIDNLGEESPPEEG